MENESLHIGYVRVSTDEQAQHGYSIDFQKERLKEKFESMNIKDFLILVDDGVSGKSLKRPKMSKAVDWIKNQEVETFIVYKLDRLSRNLSDLINFMEECNKYEVNFVSIAEELDMSNAFGRMFVYIIGIFAQFEREQISERTISGMMEKANQGKYPYSHTPFGYDKLDDQTLVINEEEKQVMLEIFDLYVNQYKSVDFVRNYAKERGIEFRHPLERLSNTLYRGYVNIPKDSDNRFDICEPIFSEEDMKDIETRKHHNQMHYGYKHKYKFRNKVIINGVNAKHTKKIKNGKEYNYYYVKGSPYVNEAKIVEFVNNQLKLQEEKRKEKITEQVSDLAYELAIGSITKIEFDKKYSNIYACNNSIDYPNWKIYIKAYFKKDKKIIEYSL